MRLTWIQGRQSYIAYAGALRLEVKQKPRTRGGEWFVREVFGNKLYYGTDFSEPTLAMRAAEREGRFMLRIAQKALSPKKGRK